MYRAEVINTKHWIPTGKFTKKGKEIKRPVVHRRVFLTVNGNTPIGLVANLRIVRVSRRGDVTYSLSGRKETGHHWWVKLANGQTPPNVVADKYTKLDYQKVPMTRSEVIRFLGMMVGPNASMILDELDMGEPMEGDAGRDALERYGYEVPEYVEVAEAA